MDEPFNTRINNILFRHRQNEEKRNLNVHLEELTEEVKNIENVQSNLKTTYDTGLNEYIKRCTELQLTKDMVSYYNIKLQEKQNIIYEENKKLDELHYEVWNEEDKFCENVWKFSEQHNFCAYLNQDLGVMEVLECEQKPRVDFEKDIQQNSQVQDLMAEINTLKEEIEEIAVNADVTKQCIKKALSEMNELKKFSEQNTEIIRLTDALKQSQLEILKIEAEIAMEVKMQKDYNQADNKNRELKVVEPLINVKSGKGANNTTEYCRYKVKNGQINNDCMEIQINDSIDNKKRQVQSLLSVTMKNLKSKNSDMRSREKNIKKNLNLTKQNLIKTTEKPKENRILKNDTSQLSEFTTAFKLTPSELEFGKKRHKNMREDMFPSLKKQRPLCSSVKNNETRDFVSAKKLFATSNPTVFGNDKQQLNFPLKIPVESERCIKPMLTMPDQFEGPTQNVTDNSMQRDYNHLQQPLSPSSTPIIHERTKPVKQWGKYSLKKRSRISIKLAERRQCKLLQNTT